MSVSIEKPSRVVDENALAAVREKPCLVCGRDSDPCHIISRGAGGPDAKWNLLPLCRFHHTEQHKSGWRKFWLDHGGVRCQMELLGWYWMEQITAYGTRSHILSHDKERKGPL